MGLKEISRKLGLSRNTVRKVVRSDATDHTYERMLQPLPRLGEYVASLEDLLKKDWKRPKKRRFTTQRLFKVLKSEGYGGGYGNYSAKIANE